MTICIYALDFCDNIYIGKSNNVERRLKDHIRSFIDKTCVNPKLQKAYDLYGIPKLHIIEICEVDRLGALEIQWIKEFDSINNGLNMTNGGDGGGSGTEHNRSLYSKEVLIEVVNLLAYTPLKSYKEINTITKVSISTISNIVNRFSHTWLMEELPIEYAKITSIDYIKGRVCAASKSKANANKLSKLGMVTYPEIVSPNGIIYNISNAASFAEEHNLCKAGLSRLLNGVIKSHRSWKLK